MDLIQARILGTVVKKKLRKQQEKRAVFTKKALKLVSTLEAEPAQQQVQRDSSVRTTPLPDRDIALLIYLSQRYGGFYKAMARDPTNLFRYTTKKIANLMKIY